ncbi:hypothetical protein NQ315_012052 [Exocentrus adspersus]|uniref:DNA-directed DNA polymerase n=1 Tax=Exocentrus adspersus TaxID=1586481 RepID=A0AAV8VII8_9CUCU|nr:hypothetical protein NQ315_012052 [Exocentrus adspersus]
MSSETITSLSSTIVKTTEEAVKLVKTKEEITVNQEQTENPLRLEGNLALLKYYLAKLQYLLHASSKVGGGLDNTEKKQRSRRLVWHSINSSFKGRVCTGLIAHLSIKDPLCFLNNAFNNFQRKIKTHRQKSMLKVNVVLVCNFIKPQSGDIEKKTFATKNHTIDINTNLKTWYRDNVIHILANKLEEFSEKDSGWALLEVLHLKVNINNFSPLKGETSTYNSQRREHFSTSHGQRKCQPYFQNNCLPMDTKLSYAVNYQKHTAFSVAYYLKCSYDDSLSSFKVYRNHDCISWFISELKDIAFNGNSILKNSKEMETLSFEQEINYETATHCHICNKPFTSNDIKVRDHCHLTSKYRGATHQDCNLNYQNSFNITVVFHNLSGPIRLLPVNKEKYISFTKIVEGTEVQLRFIDSYRFMSSSLDKLSSYLEDEKKTIVRAHCNTDKEFNLLTRKGVFPYDYIDSWERFTETCLPSKTNFYSQLYDQCITDQDYQHALDVWKTFNIKTLGEYSDLYLKNDVLLLADIFENFRRTCLLTY